MGKLLWPNMIDATIRDELLHLWGSYQAWGVPLTVVVTAHMASPYINPSWESDISPLLSFSNQELLSPSYL